MEGIDTNVLIRFLVKDDPQQYQQVLSLFIEMPKVYLSPIVLVETVQGKIMKAIHFSSTQSSSVY